MKILQVIPYLNPKMGGDVNVCHNLSRELANRGHEVTLITTDFHLDPDYADSLRQQKVEVIVFKCVADIKLFLYSPEMKKWLIKNIQKMDFVQIHGTRSYQSVVVYQLATRYGVPYTIYAHGAIMPFFQKRFLKVLFDEIWGYKVLKNAYKVIALSNMEHDQYQKMGVREDKIEIVPNGINLEEYQNLPAKNQFRKKYGIKPDEKIILYLGRINKIKGLDLLADASADILLTRSDVRLVLVGPDDGVLTKIKRQVQDLGIEEKVIMTGPLYGEAKMEAYVDSDVYVLPSVYEIFPTTVLESWASGIPVIVTDRCSIYDLVEKAGLVVEYDKNQLTEAINKILNDEGLREEKSLQGLEIVKNFNWPEVVKLVENIYYKGPRT